MVKFHPEEKPMPYKHGRKVIVIMPAYNAEKTLQRTLDDIPMDWVDEIILVDDHSRDGTVALARKLGLASLRPPRRTGATAATRRPATPRPSNGAARSWSWSTPTTSTIRPSSPR